MFVGPNCTTMVRYATKANYYLYDSFCLCANYLTFSVITYVSLQRSISTEFQQANPDLETLFLYILKRKINSEYETKQISKFYSWTNLLSMYDHIKCYRWTSRSIVSYNRYLLLKIRSVMSERQTF